MPATLAMDTNDTSPSSAGLGYVLAQLAAAARTGDTHPDPATRARGRDRAQRWSTVLRGMLSGSLQPGSRKPVTGLPSWVTLEVVRGGFATGRAVAEGPLTAAELTFAQEAGIPASRSELFAYWLTEPGQLRLRNLLDSGCYRIDVPEAAAVLVLAWLIRSGDVAAASRFVEQLAPLADRLRFTPTPAATPAPDPQIMWRATAGQTAAALRAKKPRAQVEAMREAVTVWAPFSDQVLGLWCETVRDGRVAAHYPDGWTARASSAIDRYRVLAAAHTTCAKHRHRKSNLSVMLRALDTVVGGQDLESRTSGLLQCAVDGAIAKRGAPASPVLERYRRDQAATVTPGHHRLAQLVAGRLDAADPEVGIVDVDAVTTPVNASEAASTSLPPGEPIPDSVVRTARRAMARPIELLLGAGVVPSAEVLAQLTPNITAEVVGRGYSDRQLGALMTAHHRAFMARRSLLLVDLQHQVRPAELPWVQAVAARRRVQSEDGRVALRRLAKLTLDAFPATLVPNPMVSQWMTLSRQSGDDLPWVEELAADIFAGRFSAKYLRAAQVAASVLTDSLYARYFDIDYSAIAAADPARPERRGVGSSSWFDQLCYDRAGNPTDRWDVAANGMVIEQAQILTTHNLATLVQLGVTPTSGWKDLAQRTFAQLLGLVSRIPGNPRQLPLIKDVAYAWRQMVFYLSLVESAPQEVEAMAGFLARSNPAVRERLAPAMTALTRVAAGGRFADDATSDSGRRLTGWTTERHWLIDSSS
ncbi:hypothetical protein [Pilimelia columellifera]|uniref:Uncharacterized protein n=1 Tax=Pilimelia columellifera subsp. columellifera TaxID=706583 RepID=A0ABP6B1J2_9ACTN